VAGSGNGWVVEEHLIEADGLREVAARGGWRGCPAAVLGPRCPAWLGHTGSGPGVRAIQMLGCSPGGRCLRGVLLSLAKLGHRRGQLEEAGQQPGDGGCAVAADVADQCEQPCGGAQPPGCLTCGERPALAGLAVGGPRLCWWRAALGLGPPPPAMVPAVGGSLGRWLSG